MKTDESTKGLLLFASCVAAAVALAPAAGSTETCEEKCAQAYANCAAVEAKGCDTGADAGTDCGERLAPCLRDKETCLAGCSVSEEDVWIAAVSLDRQGDAVGAIEAYDIFVERFPQSGRVVAALERISLLRAEAAAARTASIEAESGAYLALRSTTDPAWILKRGADYLSSFPEGANRSEVERMMADARSVFAAEEERKRAEEERKRRKKVGRPQRGWGIGLMSLGGALGVTGGILGGVAMKQYNDLKDECGEFGCSQADRDDNYTKAVVTDCLLGAAAVSLVTGIIVTATAPSWEEQNAPVAFSAGPTPDGNGAMAGVGGTF